VSWKDKLKKIMDEITEEYSKFRSAKFQIINDIKDIFQYAAISADKLEYIRNINNIHDASRTYVSAACSKKNLLQGNLLHRIHVIRNDLNSLESIVSDNRIISGNKHSKTNNNTNYDTDIKSRSTNNRTDGVSNSEETAFSGKNASTDKTEAIHIVENAKIKHATDTIYSANIVCTAKNYSPEKLSQIIKCKNKYFRRTDIQLQDIIKKETNIDVQDVSLLLKEAMGLKITNTEYSSIARINYDSSLASSDMKEDFIRAYTSKDMTLKEISKEFEKKYGMHISISTISRNSRKYLHNQGLDFKNRKEAKKYYMDKSK